MDKLKAARASEKRARMRKYANERYATDPEYRERKRAYIKQWRKDNHERFRATALRGARRRAGFPEPTRPCPENCEMCGRPQSEFKHSLHLDHCHTTGVFRGWLCHMCNTALGKLGDSIEGAIELLEKYRRMQPCPE